MVFISLASDWNLFTYHIILSKMSHELGKFFPGHFYGQEVVFEAERKFRKHLSHNMRQISQSLDNLNQFGSLSLNGKYRNYNGIKSRLINSVVPLGIVQSNVQQVLQCRQYNFCGSMENISRFKTHFCDWEPRVVKKRSLKCFDELTYDGSMERHRSNGLGVCITTHKRIHVSKSYQKHRYFYLFISIIYVCEKK